MTTRLVGLHDVNRKIFIKPMAGVLKSFQQGSAGKENEAAGRAGIGLACEIAIRLTGCFGRSS